VSDPLKVAILGYWHVHAADYAQEAQDHPDTEIVAVWDEDVERGRAGADACGVEFVPDLDALLARDELDAVIVTTETSRHADVMVRAAAARKHIFTEKVLAPTVAEAEAIIGATDAAGVRCQG
jgi:1,5-anhydro-D-fructose reductase (1,5-anhydro-D-mannitol-forming)